jgi:hypothetical protein
VTKLLSRRLNDAPKFEDDSVLDMGTDVYTSWVFVFNMPGVQDEKTNRESPKVGEANSTDMAFENDREVFENDQGSKTTSMEVDLSEHADTEHLAMLAQKPWAKDDQRLPLEVKHFHCHVKHKACWRQLRDPCLVIGMAVL